MKRNETRLRIIRIALFLAIKMLPARPEAALCDADMQDQKKNFPGAVSYLQGKHHLAPCLQNFKRDSLYCVSVAKYMFLLSTLLFQAVQG